MEAEIEQNVRCCRSGKPFWLQKMGNWNWAEIEAKYKMQSVAVFKNHVAEDTTIGQKWKLSTHYAVKVQ